MFELGKDNKVFLKLLLKIYVEIYKILIVLAFFLLAITFLINVRYVE